MDKEFKEIIMKHEKEILHVMDEHQLRDPDKWFEKVLEEDHDFPSHYAIGTELYTTKGKSKCVFKDKNNYCSIQLAAEKYGMHKWAIKPKYCIMYPLTIEDNVLTYDADHSARLSYCGMKHKKNFTQTVFEAMKEEISYILGFEGYCILNDYFEKNYKHKVKS